MTELLHRPGFLGTSANLAADVTLVLMLLVAAMFTVGLVMARRRRYQVHRWIQTSAAVLNAILVLWLMVLPFRDFVLRDVGGPRPTIFYAVTTLHALFGAVAFPFGMFVTLRGNGLVPKALKFNNYKLFMRTAYGLYMFTTLLGILVYLTWFVIIPNPPLYS
jgi:uncharacterized membrane protein YozB (DUF420 family)